MKKIFLLLAVMAWLSNLIGKEAGMTADDAKSKNRVLEFTVGIPLSLN